MSNNNEYGPPQLAYLDEDFIKSRDARVIRILAEYLEPAARMRKFHIKDTIVFFGSARSVSPEQADLEYKQLNEDIQRAGEMTVELSEQLAAAEYRIKLSKYYEDAMELARRLTEWSKGLTSNRHFIVCSGGSAGMMEAANRGASIAHGKTMGLNIKLPREQMINHFVSRELRFNFHYFFMRKFWFVYPAKALIVFPGGFGTMDELFEVLTLIQTKLPEKEMPVVLFGTEFWREVINFDALVRWGVVSSEDLKIFYMTDSVDDAFSYLKKRLGAFYHGGPKDLRQVRLT